jgi:hypothetical protein
MAPNHIKRRTVVKTAMIILAGCVEVEVSMCGQITSTHPSGWAVPAGLLTGFTKLQSRLMRKQLIRPERNSIVFYFYYASVL